MIYKVIGSILSLLAAVYIGTLWGEIECQKKNDKAEDKALKQLQEDAKKQSVSGEQDAKEIKNEIARLNKKLPQLTAPNSSCGTDVHGDWLLDNYATLFEEVHSE